MSRLGWWLMGWPTGWRKPSSRLLRYGPYRWGSKLTDRATIRERTTDA